MKKINLCETCKYWSSRCARSIGGGPMEALCFSPKKPTQDYVSFRASCTDYEKGKPIDE
jgi:hypothetical protein